MNTSDTLNKAADLIEERGWAQGSAGWPGWEGAGRGLCLEGGILAALGKGFEDIRGEAEAAFLSCPTYMAVVNYLQIGPDRITGQQHLYGWNDEDNRTASEVIEVLRATAVIEAAREQQTASVSA